MIYYDIGANKGTWTAEYYTPGNSFYLFEANPECEPLLRKQAHPYFIAALSDHVGATSLWLQDDKQAGTGVSLFKENTQYYSQGRSVEVKTVMLDALVEENGLPLPDFMKVDCQGSELNVLKGGSKCLQNTKTVLLELPVDGVVYNIGAPSRSEYLTFMEEAGFELVETKPEGSGRIHENATFKRK